MEVCRLWHALHTNEVLLSFDSNDVCEIIILCQMLCIQRIIQTTNDSGGSNLGRSSSCRLLIRLHTFPSFHGAAASAFTYTWFQSGGAACQWGISLFQGYSSENRCRRHLLAVLQQFLPPPPNTSTLHTPPTPPPPPHTHTHPHTPHTHPHTQSIYVDGATIRHHIFLCDDFSCRVGVFCFMVVFRKDRFMAHWQCQGLLTFGIMMN